MWSEEKINMTISEVPILYVNGRITTEVYHCIVFVTICCLVFANFELCFYHVDYYRRTYVCYIMLGFCDM